MNIKRYKAIIRSIFINGLILLVPFVLQLTIGTGLDGQGFNWTASDFIIMGSLLFGVSVAIEFIAKKVTNPTRRIIATASILALFLLIWAHLAVGVVDSWPFAGS